MAKKKSNTTRTKRKRSYSEQAAQAQFDLRSVDPKGRLDVLVAQSIERLIQSRAPELLPVVDKQRGVIHAAINERLGPHAIGFDVIGLIDCLKPYAPLIGVIAQSALNNLRTRSGAQAPKGNAA